MDPSVEHLYDEYLDAAMAGKVLPPDEFLRRRGVVDEVLQRVLASVYDGHVRTQGGPAGHAPTDDEPADQSPAPKKSDVLGDFRLIERLGEGGMGVVFLAEQISLRRRVAVKLLRPEISSSKSAAARFEREALAAARLNHPSIVAVIAVGEHRGARYIAMEYVEGVGLDEVLRQAAQGGEPVAVLRAVRWCCQIAQALAAAHQQNIVHRDVKPSNIRITPDDRALLLDFGVARDLDSTGGTLTETFIGSPFYAAPEQVAASGGQIDGRTDVYSAGLVLYECVTGTMPFAGRSLEQALHSILTVEPPPPRRCGRGVPRDVDTVVMKAIDKSPARRYQSAAALADDLLAILELRPISARPHGRIERVMRWARRRRAAAAALATGAAALALGLMLAAGLAVRQQRENARQIHAIVSEARSLLDSYTHSRASIMEQEAYYEIVSKQRGARFMSREEDAKVDAAETAVRTSRRQREGMFYRVLDLASQAERAGASSAQAEELRARAYLQRYLEAELADLIELPLYRDLVMQHDPRGLLTAELRGQTHLSLKCAAPGVSFDVFRRVFDSDEREGGERRLVCVPLRGWPKQVPQGSWALRVVPGSSAAHAGGLEPEDHIIEVCGQPVRDSVFVSRDAGNVRRGARLVSIDGKDVQDVTWARTFDAAPAPQGGHEYVLSLPGTPPLTLRAASLQELGIELAQAKELAEAGGVRARVWTKGTLTDMELPPGLSLRTTASPLLPGELSRVDPSQAGSLDLEPGDYVVLARAPGMESVRLAVGAQRGSTRALDIQLLPAGTTPPGFVRLEPNLRPPRWVMEHEVTLREYFEFLNDPQTLSEVNASPQRIRYPYNGEEANGQRDSQGRFLKPEGWEWDWPALHVSWNDAAAYAAWRAQRERAAGRDWTFELPTQDEVVAASGCGRHTDYVFGDRFSAKWCSSCFSRVKPWPEHVMSYPVDESALGVFDLAGSASEWTRTRWQDHLPHYMHSGGSWASGDPLLFRVYGGNGALPERSAGFIGFRLIMRGKGT